MLRLKDLFKIDFSSKGGGKLADKIFNKYNITKEEREEVKNEIVNGGGGGDSEDGWYEIIGEPVKYSKLDTLISSDMIEIIGGYAGTLSNNVTINSIKVIEGDPICYFVQCKGFLALQLDEKKIVIEYNNFEQFIRVFGEFMNVDDSTINIIIEDFYTKFKKVTYSRVLEKMKSLIPA